MAKPQSGGKNRNAAVKQKGAGIKNGSVGKNKNPKFKKTPTKKVDLINTSRSPINTKKQVQKNDIRGKNQTEAKVKTQGKKLASSKQSPVKDNDETLDDIESDDNVPDIFGESLANDSDDDDNDFDVEEEDDDDDDGEDDDENEIDDDDENEIDDDEDDDDDDEDEDEDEDDGDNDNDIADKNVECKGVKMFKGVKSIKQKQGKGSTEQNSNKSNLSALSTDISLSTNEDDDGHDDDDSDEDDDNENESTEDEETEGDESGVGLNVLLGKSIVDDEEDEDFNGTEEDDEDDDISDDSAEEEDSSNVSKIKQDDNSKDDHANEIKRTIFVGNLPSKGTNEEDVKKFFSEFGNIESIRIKGVIPENPYMARKFAALKHKIQPNQIVYNAYIVYETEESAKQALCKNGEKYKGNYIRVDMSHSQHIFDHKKAVFVGNLHYGIDVNSIWDCFDKCGKIDNVHLVRDRETGLTKGFGYINFKSEDAVALALELDGTQLLDREMRVKPYTAKPVNTGQKRHHSAESHKFSPEQKKRFIQKTSIGDHKKNAFKGKQNAAEKSKYKGSNSSPGKSNPSFQGQKADLKKKKGNTKLPQKQKIMAAKLLAKSKKPSP